MSEKAFMDTFREVGMEGECVLTIGPDADALGLVRLFANEAKAIDYWGKVDLNVPPQLARKIAAALIACADEVEAP